MLFFKLAWRNIFRNARRSVITVTAIAVGLAALIFLWAFVDGVNDQMAENSTRYLAGHLQIHRSGYHEQRTLDLLLEQSGNTVRRLRALPHVVAVTQRLEGSALLSLGDKSRGVMVVGVDPNQEPRVTTLTQAVRAGRYLRAADGNAILLGASAAAALKAQVGSEVVLVTQAADGSVGAGRYRVEGIFNTKMDMLDGNYVFLPLATAQELYAAGSAVTAVVARLDNRHSTEAVVGAMLRQAGAEQEILGWQKLLPTVVQSTEFHEIVAYILLLILFVVVAVGITNTVLMAVMERTREFGVMMALGTRQTQVMRLVFYEACLLGFAGLLIGAVIGLSMTQYFAVTGINLERYSLALEAMPGLTGIVFPLPRADRTLILSLVVFATAVIAAFYPAWKTARLRPVDAIRGRQNTLSVPAWLHWKKTTSNRARWPLFLKIAGRGIVRNPRRTLLTVSATAFGLAAFIFLYSFVDGYFSQMIDNSTGYVTGDLQIQHKLFRQEMVPELSLRQPASLLQKIRQQPLIAAAAPRVQTQALISSPAQSQNILLLGIDPDSERKVTFIERTVKEGKALQAGQDRDIMLGRRLAGKLGIRLGEKVVVLAQNAEGSLGSAAYRVGAIFETESEAFDNAIGFVSLRAGQALLSLGDAVSTIDVRLKDREQLAAATAVLNRELAQTPYVVVSWRELLPEVSQIIDYVRMNLNLVIGIVFFVVAMGVMNTLLMSVMERTHEFGIMMALGTRPSQIVRLVLYESIVLAAAGSVAGYLLGAMLVQYLALRGIDLSAYTNALQTIPGLTGVIYPRLQNSHLLVPLLLLLGISAIAAFYPGWRAAQLKPVEALHHV